jgi:hypothetical protein
VFDEGGENGLTYFRGGYGFVLHFIVIDLHAEFPKS